MFIHSSFLLLEYFEALMLKCDENRAKKILTQIVAQEMISVNIAAP